MLKQSIFYFILSMFVVIFAEYANIVVVYIAIAYSWLIVQLKPIFFHNIYGSLICNIFALTILPIIIAGIPALGFRAVKGQQMPGFFELTWSVWLVIVLSKVLMK